MTRKPICSAENVLQFWVDWSCILPRFVHRLDQIRLDWIRLDQIRLRAPQGVWIFSSTQPLSSFTSKVKQKQVLFLLLAALGSTKSQIVCLSVCWSVGRPQGFVKKLQKSSCPSVGCQVCRTGDFVKKLDCDYDFVITIL